MSDAVDVFETRVVISSEAKELIRAFSGAVAFARTFTIDSPEMAQAANRQIQIFREQHDAVRAVRDKAMKPAEDELANARAYFDPALNDNAAAQKVLKDALMGWDAAESTRLAEERRKAAEAAAEARRKAEAEAAAIRAKAEEQAKEARRRADEAERARRQAEAEGNARVAAVAAATAAKQFEAARGIEEKAQEQAARIQIAAQASHPVPSVARAKVPGWYTRSKWIGEVTDKRAATEYIGQHPEFDELIDFNQSALNRMAGALKHGLRIPGIRVVEDRTGVSRKT